MNKAALVLVLALAACGCAPPALVVISPSYNPARIRSVALAGFQDYSLSAGSGEVASGIFEKYLLLGGYKLVDRVQAEKIMQDRGLSLQSGLDLAALRQLGQAMGVDAMAIGQLSDFSEASDHTVIEDVALEQVEPIYARQTTVERVGRKKVRTDTDVVVGYNSSTTHTPVEETLENPAHVAMSVRLVDTETGETLWSGSASAHAEQTHEAAEEASAMILKALGARLKELGKASAAAP